MSLEVSVHYEAITTIYAVNIFVTSKSVLLSLFYFTLFCDKNP